MLAELLLKWPLIRQLRTGADGTGAEAMSERTFDDGVMHTEAIAHLGGATLDIEENYLIKKLFTAGLGMVCLSNQARI